MRNVLNSIPQQIKTYVATVVVTLLGYVGLTCSSNCVQCYACVPVGVLVLGSLFSKNIKMRLKGFSFGKGKHLRNTSSEKLSNKRGAFRGSDLHP